MKQGVLEEFSGNLSRFPNPSILILWDFWMTLKRDGEEMKWELVNSFSLRGL